MGGRRGMWPLVACLTGILCLGSELATAGEAAEVVAVTPHLQDGLLVCDVHTTGLPGEKINSSVRSGLVSSIDLILELIQADDGHRLATGQASFQLAFDLWDEVFTLRTDTSRVLLEDLQAVQEHLALLRGLPVSSLDALPDLNSQTSLFMKVSLVLRPIADRDRKRVEEVISGSSPVTEGGQEAKIDLGRLIRFFYKDRDDPTAGSGGPGQGGRSSLFSLKELQHVSD